MAVKANLAVKESQKKHNVPNWLLGDLLTPKCSENTVLRKLRHELPQEEQEKIISLIESYAHDKTEKA